MVFILVLQDKHKGSLCDSGRLIERGWPLAKGKTETKAPFWRSPNSDDFPLPQTWSFLISLAAFFLTFPEEKYLLEKFRSLQ